ncbi:MAG: hypothetical protein A2W91_05860 [Bacteroidetes bacterium GWF2_38_335]|nr:MAG: hypothetical protein A2W91_05860 [Bacteroidetes bacterium GWF2_38_335]OFY81601.1 MAG: hypothetical protein A2281_11655 [Bacteroidetes bacterium RIFOXYA12_FULL_38_20]HBS88951.1 hypothetical protein [Bacteroidales bacterium]
MKKNLNQILKEALVGKKVVLSSLTNLESDKSIIVRITDCDFEEKKGDDDDKFIYFELPDGTISYENMDWGDEIEFVQ